MSLKLSPPLFVALDVDQPDPALKLAIRLKGLVGGFKIGPRLALRGGPSLIKEMSACGLTFLDFKFFDIPSTMESSVLAAFNMGATVVTVHAMAGSEALKRLSDLEHKLGQRRPFKILAVTLLTSFSPKTLPPNFSTAPLADQVNQLVQLTVDCGLSGVVCSPQEAQGLRQQFPDLFILTPGVRFKDEEKGDQSRIMEPREALAAGSSALVVGRPIVEAADPVAAARRYFEAITS